MGYDYGDMMRDSARQSEERRLLREYGKQDDPPEYAVELARGREAIDHLSEIRDHYKRWVNLVSR